MNISTNTAADDVTFSGYRDAVHKRLAPAWKIVADLSQGALHVRDCGEEYLLKFPREEADAYAERLRWRSVFYDHFRRTLKGFTGLVFSSDPSPNTDNTPKPILELFDDIDMLGHDLATALMIWFEEYIRDGNGYFLIDHPPAVEREDGESPTLADIGDNRPFVVYYRANQLINHRYGDDGKFDQATFEEYVELPEGEFGQKGVIRHLIFRRAEGRVTWERRTFDTTKAGAIADKTKYESETGTAPVNYIPVVPITDIGAPPPFLGIGLLNVLHYNKTSDFDNWCHLANVPQLVFQMNEETDKDAFAKLTQAPNRSLLGWGEHFKAYFVEVSGNGADVTTNRIKDIEAQMARLGLEKLSPFGAHSAKTATEIDSDNIQSQSELAMLTRRFENAVEIVFYVVGEYLNATRGKNTVDLDDAEGSRIKLNIEYDKLTFSVEQWRTLAAEVKEGRLSLTTYLSLLPQLLDILPDDFKPEEELQRIAKERAMMAPAEPDLLTRGGKSLNALSKRLDIANKGEGLLSIEQQLEVLHDDWSEERIKAEAKRIAAEEGVRANARY